MANIIIVNGAPRSGKDTFVNFCLKELKGLGKSVSTVDFVKEVAKFCGWDGEKAWQGVVYYREYFNVKGYLENSLYPGVPELLERLKTAGVRMAVATSKPEEFAVKILEHYGVDKYFDFIGGATPDRSRVHKIDVIFYVIHELGDPDRNDIVMVGDKENDVFGAKCAGLPCIGVLYGYGGREELESAGADFIVADTEELFDLIRK